MIDYKKTFKECAWISQKEIQVASRFESFKPIPDHYLDLMIQGAFTVRELRVLMFMFKRSELIGSIRFYFSKQETIGESLELTRPAVASAISSFLSQKIIVVEKFWKVNCYIFQKCNKLDEQIYRNIKELFQKVVDGQTDIQVYRRYLDDKDKEAKAYKDGGEWQ